MSLISLFLTSIFSENIVLTKFLGLCPFFGNSKREKTAVAMGLCVIFVMCVSSVLSFFIYNFVLVPTGTEYLSTLMFILLIASLVQLLVLIIKNKNKKMYKSLGIYLSLITTNCAVLGVVLLGINNGYNLLETIVYSLGSGIGFMLVIYVFGTIRERLEQSDVPKCFQGIPIALITASIMALIFERFKGL